MTTRQEILLRLACAALQGGMSISKVYQSIDGTDDEHYTLWDIADVIPDIEFDADTPPEKILSQPLIKRNSINGYSS